MIKNIKKLMKLVENYDKIMSVVENNKETITKDKKAKSYSTFNTPMDQVEYIANKTKGE